MTIHDPDLPPIVPPPARPLVNAPDDIRHLDLQQTMRLADLARIYARAYRSVDADGDRGTRYRAEAERWTRLANFLADSEGVAIARHGPRESGSIPATSPQP